MLHISLLGRYDVRLNDEPLELSLRPVQNLLAYLILNRDKRHRREQLAGILWPDYTEASARKNLRNTLYRLRQAIGEGYLTADRSNVAFNTDTAFWLDVAQLEEAESAEEIEERIQAADLYQGELLPGYYEDWILRERERLQAVFERQMQGLLERLNAAGCWSESLTWAERWIAQGTAPEAAYRSLMLAHAGLGDQAGVSAVYQRCVKALEEEIGVEPSTETKALFQRISSGQDLPELRKVDPKSRPKVRLPLQPTPFIGRKNELEELGALLADPAIRLVNIIGPGGIGKTRLAIETARTQSDAFSIGVYFVSLAALDDPNLIATPIANAINFSFRVRDQREKDYRNEQLLAYLRDKKIMLVLDNVEHLLDGLSLLAEILQVAPDVKILTTSRERLGLRGETVYTLGSMFVPENVTKEAPLIVETHDALQLFVQCAERAQPNFELTSSNLNAVVTVCHLVDGLPLGIELAAAWAGLLTPGEIAAEIEINLDFLSSNYVDMPDRQRSIRSVFESSWNRLTDIEQGVFQQLSVFRGGFTRQAAESVTGATLQILMALVNKSLVKPDYSGRYHLHELLRQFGSEKLREAGETGQAKDRHLAFFLKVAEESGPNLEGSDQITWANRLELEHDNLRAALEWSQTAERTAESGLRLTGSLAYFWQWRGYFGEGREHLSAALSSSEASQRTEARAKGLYEAGRLAYVQSDFPEAGALIEESLSIYRELGPASRLSLAHALIMLGDTKTGVGDYTEAVSVIEEGLGIMRELNERSGSARALWKLGWCMVSQGDYEQASECFAEALPFYKRIGDKDGLSMVLSGLGEVALRQGDDGGATELLEESLALRRQAGDTWGIAASFGTLAWVALRQGDLNIATTLLIESLQLRRELGDRGGTAWCLEKLAEIALIKGQRESAPRREEDFLHAARLFGAAAALRAPVDSAIDLVDRPEYERQLAVLQTQLDEATFTAAWADGQAMTFEQAIEYALEVEPGQLGLSK